MGVAIPIETSARHIHMCRNDFEALFGEGSELTYKADLRDVYKRQVMSWRDMNWSHL